MQHPTNDDQPDAPVSHTAKRRKVEKGVGETNGDPALLGKSLTFNGLGDSTPIDMEPNINIFSMSASSSAFLDMCDQDVDIPTGELRAPPRGNVEYSKLLNQFGEEEPPTSVKMDGYPHDLYGAYPTDPVLFGHPGMFMTEGAPQQQPLMSPDGGPDEEEEEEEEGHPQQPPMYGGSAIPPPQISGMYYAPPTGGPSALPGQYNPLNGAPLAHAAPPYAHTTTTTLAQPTQTSAARKRGRSKEQEQQQPPLSYAPPLHLHPPPHDASQPQQPPQQQPTQASQEHQQFQQYMLQQMQRTTPTALIAQLANLEKSLDNHLKALRFTQRRTIDNFHNREEVDKLLKTHADLRKQIESAAKQLEFVNANYILPAPDAWHLVRLLELYQLHSKRLGVYQQEFYQVQTNPGRPPDAVALMLITKQPFPCTVKQSKSVDEIVEVQVIVGSTVDIQGQSIVQAELINEDYNPVMKKKNAAPAIQNGDEPLDENGIATFKRLTFPHGSRVKSVNMRFNVDLAVNGQHLHLQSDASRPFIVMTNHGQRSTTEGKLLKKHTFFGRSDIEWPAFANAMQLHYIRATKQEPLKPTRPLSLKDIEYLHITKFNGKPLVNQEEYDGFWAWFGTILYKIRNHQKHILPMWIKGLIYGFLSREDSDRLLQTQTAIPGSFLVRFSDRCAGQFVVVYVQAKKDDPSAREVKHYLIRPDDIEKKSTLPDFLKDCENLWYLLQVVRDPDTGVVSLRPRNKDEILGPYYTRERQQQLPYGYAERRP